MSREGLQLVRAKAEAWVTAGLSIDEVLDCLGNKHLSAADAVTVVWAVLSLPMDEARDRVANHPAWRWDVMGSHDALFNTVDMREETISDMSREVDDLRRKNQ